VAVNAALVPEPEPGRSAPERSEALVESYRRLAAVFHEVLSEQSPEALLDRIADALGDLVPHQDLHIYEADEQQRELVPVFALGSWTDEVMASSITYGQGITGWAVAHRSPVLANEAHLDPRVEFVPGQALPLFELKPPVFEGVDFAIKRTFDLVGATLLLVLLFRTPWQTVGERVRSEVDRVNDVIRGELQAGRGESLAAARETREEIARTVRELTDSLQQRIEDLRSTLDSRLMQLSEADRASDAQNRLGIAHFHVTPDEKIE